MFRTHPPLLSVSIQSFASQTALTISFFLIQCSSSYMILSPTELYLKPHISSYTRLSSPIPHLTTTKTLLRSHPLPTSCPPVSLSFSSPSSFFHFVSSTPNALSVPRVSTAPHVSPDPIPMNPVYSSASFAHPAPFPQPSLPPLPPCVHHVRKVHLPNSLDVKLVEHVAVVLIPTSSVPDSVNPVHLALSPPPSQPHLLPSVHRVLSELPLSRVNVSVDNAALAPFQTFLDHPFANHAMPVPSHQPSAPPLPPCASHALPDSSRSGAGASAVRAELVHLLISLQAAPAKTV